MKDKDNKKPVVQEITPANEIPYRGLNKPFRFQFIVPGPGIQMEIDKNGVLYVSAEGGEAVTDIIAGDNIEIDRREDGKIVISAVNTVTDVAAGQNVTITIDEETGAAVINAITGGETNEHYQGVFDTPEDLIDYDTDPEQGDYGLIKNLVFSDGGETTWNGQYKYCFYINGAWTVVDQMLTFTKDTDLLQQFYSVGGSSPVIYLHEIAKTGDFRDLNNVPIVATPVVTVEGTTVTAECATEGAEIWYSTDGSMPHVNGNKYTGPITATGATTYRFVGIKNGMINSLEAVASADYELQAPTIELDWHDGKITMTNPNVDGNGDPVGNIYYTLDLSTPTDQSNLYSGPFTCYNGVSISAIIIDRDNDRQSSVSFESFYMLSVPRIETNTNWINGYRSVSVFSDENPIVKYTIGQDSLPVSPVFNDDTYNSPFVYQLFSGPAYIIVKPFKENYIPGNTHGLSDFWYKSGPDSPLIVFDSNTNKISLQRSGNTVPIPLYTTPENPELGCRIYYTLDGSTPTDQSTLYTGPFQVSGNVTVKAVMVAYGQYYSDVATENITVLAPPQISFGLNVPTTFHGLVTLTNPNNAGEIRYTTDGSTPTAESPLYSSVIHLSRTKTVKAIVVDNGAVSAVAEQTFTQLPAAQYNDSVNYSTGLEKISVSPQSYNGMSVSHYVGLFLSAGHQELYPYTLAAGSYSKPEMKLFGPYWEFECYSVLDGYIPKKVSDVDGGLMPDAPTISYDEQGGTVTFSRGNNTTLIPLQTNNNTPELGCRVYYTLDGSTPDDTSKLWDGNPVSVAPGTTVKAVLVCYGMYASAVTTYSVPAQAGGELYFEASEANTNIYLFSTLLETAPDLEISEDGINWQSWQATEDDGTFIFDIVNLSDIGDKLYIRGDNPNGLTSGLGEVLSIFIIDKPVLCAGDIRSLIDKDSYNELSAMPPVTGLFMGKALGMGESLLSAPDLPCEYVNGYAYGFLFCGNDLLLHPAAMGATNISAYCFYQMYAGCFSLLEGADLSLSPSAVSAEGWCEDMYAGCSFAMSDNGTDFSFDFDIDFPFMSFSTASEMAMYMGNVYGFGGSNVVIVDPLIYSSDNFYRQSNLGGFDYEKRYVFSAMILFGYPKAGENQILTLEYSGNDTFAKWQKKGQNGYEDFTDNTDNPCTYPIESMGCLYFKAVFNN